MVRKVFRQRGDDEFAGSVLLPRLVSLMSSRSLNYGGVPPVARQAAQRGGRIINISGLAALQTGSTIGSIRNVGVATAAGLLMACA